MIKSEKTERWGWIGELELNLFFFGGEAWGEKTKEELHLRVPMIPN